MVKKSICTGNIVQLQILSRVVVTCLILFCIYWWKFIQNCLSSRQNKYFVMHANVPKRLYIKGSVGAANNFGPILENVSRVMPRLFNKTCECRSRKVWKFAWSPFEGTSVGQYITQLPLPRSCDVHRIRVIRMSGLNCNWIMEYRVPVWAFTELEGWLPGQDLTLREKGRELSPLSPFCSLKLLLFVGLCVCRPSDLETLRKKTGLIMSTVTCRDLCILSPIQNLNPPNPALTDPWFYEFPPSSQRQQ